MASWRWLLGPVVRALGHLEALERELRRVEGLCALLEEMRERRARTATATTATTKEPCHA